MTIRAAQIEVIDLGEKILTEKSRSKRNCFTARRSRLRMYIGLLSSEGDILEQQATISRLRAQVCHVSYLILS
jgi:hypothetical protein